jgi:hypothetical protein
MHYQTFNESKSDQCSRLPRSHPETSPPDLYKVRSTPDMGKGVFAKHDIKRGELILAERPLSSIVLTAANAIKNHYT